MEGGKEGRRRGGEGRRREGRRQRWGGREGEKGKEGTSNIITKKITKNALPCPWHPAGLHSDTGTGQWCSSPGLQPHAVQSLPPYGVRFNFRVLSLKDAGLVVSREREPRTRLLIKLLQVSCPLNSRNILLDIYLLVRGREQPACVRHSTTFW